MPVAHEQKLTARSLSDDELVQRAQSLIVQGIARPDTIDELASTLFVSRTRLCTCFKKVTGTSIGDYRTQIRLQRAKELLSESDLPYATIAQVVGYRHQSTFCNMFKQTTGVTPQQWREGVRA